MTNFDVATETTLALTEEELHNEIKSYDTAKLALLKCLKEQYSARVLLRNVVGAGIAMPSLIRR
jgi:hypothetical protein